MIIFVTSDLHGNTNLVRKMKSLPIKPDTILIAGDMGGKGIQAENIKEFSDKQRKSFENMIRELNNLEIPYKFILGNDDWFETRNKNHLTSKFSVNKEIDIIPFEWVGITPFNTNREANENKIAYELSKIKPLNPKKKTIVLAHMPPYMNGDTLYNGTHCGSKAIHNWIQENDPVLWLCGHIHEDNSVNRMINGTLVLNCASEHNKDKLKGWLIDTNTMQYSKIDIY